MLAVACDGQPPDRIDGAGATFLSDLISAWITEFEATDEDVTINFSATGSGRGVDLFARGAVDFAFSELTPNPGELSTSDYIGVPVAAGALVVAFNLDGITSLRLSRDALAQIFLGRITQWSDSAIKAENPELDLPATPITIIHREDESGSSFVFTSFLSEISPAWREGPGAGSVVSWPVGLGALGSGALVRQIQYVDGAIGYVDLRRAAETEGIGIAILQNKSGAYVAQSQASIAATIAAATELSAESMRDPEGADQSPLTVVSYLYVRRRYEAPEVAEGVGAFAAYVLSEGRLQDDSFGFVAVPARFHSAARDAVSELLQ